MARAYDHQAIEKKWQDEWEKSGIYKTENKVEGKQNLFTLVEFIYTSGDAHIGHWYAFSVPDMFVRMKRMQGYNVLYPMGFDSFGLPAENAALKNNVSPSEWTLKNIDRARRQIKSMGGAFDWSREVITCDPSYYKWTQWIFIQLFKKGLAYRGKSEVNWCPKDQTVLADEQVVDGKCERCDSVIEQKEMEQWFFKIREYADRLIDDLDSMNWPEPIKESQRNWIGRSEGAEIDFGPIKVFTTRPDTIFGATYVVVAPEHPLVKDYPEAAAYVAASKEKSEIERTAEGKEKTGVKLRLTVKNPATGESVPVWVADYVLGHYGTGAVMAVPAHDERDYEFAKKFDLPIRQVVMPCMLDKVKPPQEGLEEVARDTVVVFLKDTTTGKYAVLDWHGAQDGVSTGIMGGIEPGQTPEEAALAEIKEEASIPNARIVKTLTWVSAALYCAAHKGVNRRAIARAFLAEVDGLESQGSISAEEDAIHTLHWVTEQELLRRPLPEHQKWLWSQLQSETALTESGTLINSGSFNGLSSEDAKQKITESLGGKMTKTYRVHDWSISRQRYWGAPIPIVYDPEGKPHAIPDEHLPWLLPEDADIKPKGTSPLGSSKELVERTEKIFGKGWRPEIDTMDGFVDNSWYFLRYLDPKNNSELASKNAQQAWMPVTRYSGGAEHTTVHVLYSRFLIKALFDMGITTVPEPYLERLNRGIILSEDGRKMSKRWGNVVNPDDEVERVGADAVRTYFAFIGPYNVVGSFPWSTNGLIGVRKFLERVASLSEKVGDAAVSQELDVLINQSIKKVGEDIESMKFNTSVSQLMILSNALGALTQVPRSAYETYLKLLAPFAPHLTEELWHELGHTTSIHREGWPVYDSEKLASDTVTIAVQIGGKTRGTVTVGRGAGEEEVLEAARNEPKLKPQIPEAPSKIIFVKDRIINLIP